MKEKSFEQEKLTNTDEQQVADKEKAALLTDEELEQAAGGGAIFRPVKYE